MLRHTTGCAFKMTESVADFLHEIAVRSQRQPEKDHSHISDCRIASV